MIKKIAALGGAMALIALTTIPALAWERDNNCEDHNDRDKCCPKIEVRSSNSAFLSGNIATIANSGNRIDGQVGKHGEVESGDAKVNLDALTQVNSNETTVGEECCVTKGQVKVVSSNRAKLSGNILTVANSGNYVGSQVRGEVESGDAKVDAYVTAIVNSNVTRVN